MDDIKTTSPWPVSLKFGILGGLLTVVISYVMSMGVDFSDLETFEASQSSWGSYVGYVVLVAAVVMAQLEHRNKEMGGFMSYGRAMGVASIVTLVFALLTTLYLYLQLTMITPELLEMIQQTALKNSQGEAEQEEMILKFTTAPVITVFGFLGFAFFSIILSLIVSLFTQRSHS